MVQHLPDLFPILSLVHYFLMQYLIQDRSQWLNRKDLHWPDLFLDLLLEHYYPMLVLIQYQFRWQYLLVLLHWLDLVLDQWLMLLDLMQCLIPIQVHLLSLHPKH
jgi:hypothetical protein